MMYIEPAERYLPKIYMQFSITNNNDYLKKVYEVSVRLLISRSRVQWLSSETREGQSSLETEGHSLQFNAESSPVCTVLHIIFSNYIFLKESLQLFKSMGLKILLKQPGSPHFLVLSTWYTLTAWWPQIPSWVWWTGFASWCKPLGAMTFSRPCGFSSHHTGTYTIVPLLKAVSKSTWHKYKMPDSIDNTTLVPFLFFPFHDLHFSLSKSLFST